MSAIDELVHTLLTGTTAGQISWERQDSRGRVFVAKRDSGTIQLDAPGMTGSGYRLLVMDADGRQIEEVSAAAPLEIAGFSTSGNLLLSPAVRELPALYETVRESVTQVQQKLRTIARDFGRPE